MNIKFLSCTLLLLSSVVGIAADLQLPQGFNDLVQKKGQPYRDAVVLILRNVGLSSQLDNIISQETPSSINSVYAKILLAHIRHPEVFSGLEGEIKKWRDREKKSTIHNGQPGFLSSLLMQYVTCGLESKYVYVNDDTGDKKHSSDRLTIRGAYRKKVDKYTDSEVQTGIARNAAARQAVFEYVMKYLDDGEAYEQIEMVELADRLQKNTRSERWKKEPIVNNLFYTIFSNQKYSVAARMRAAFCLPADKQKEIVAFMLEVVDNTPDDNKYHQSDDMIIRALAYLEYYADAKACAILKNRANDPPWKTKKINDTVRVIEIRLISSSSTKMKKT